MTCPLPPKGWTCSRAKGHDGPCAASLEGYSDDFVAGVLAATCPLTHEEAITCKMSNPYSEVTHGRTNVLMALRRKRLLEERNEAV